MTLVYAQQNITQLCQLLIIEDVVDLTYLPDDRQLKMERCSCTFIHVYSFHEALISQHQGSYWQTEAAIPGRSSIGWFGLGAAVWWRASRSNLRWRLRDYGLDYGDSYRIKYSTSLSAPRHHPHCSRRETKMGGWPVSQRLNFLWTFAKRAFSAKTCAAGSPG